MTELVSGPAYRRTGLTIAVIAALFMVWALSGCGADDAPQAAQVSPPTGGLTVRDPWVKAADQGMTAAFAVLVNSGPRDVTVVGAASDVSESVELHEMAMQDGGMVMREKPGGLTVPAGGEYRLEPGGDHLMLMGLDRPVQAGDQITLTLTLSDGTTVEFSAVAKPFTGAQESYQPGHGTGSMGD